VNPVFSQMNSVHFFTPSYNFNTSITFHLNQVISVGIVTMMYDHSVEFRFPAGTKDFSLHSFASILVLRPTKRRVQWLLGTLCPGIKRQEHECDHSVYCLFNDAVNSSDDVTSKNTMISELTVFRLIICGDIPPLPSASSCVVLN
jgi:hypothetical protein